MNRDECEKAILDSPEKIQRLYNNVQMWLIETITKVQKAEGGYPLDGNEMMLLIQGMLAGINMGMSINKKGFEYSQDDLREVFTLISNTIIAANEEAATLTKEFFGACLEGKIQ